MSKVLNLLFVLSTCGLFAQQAYAPRSLSDGNYVLERTYQEKKNKLEEIKYESDVIEVIQYFDGLGRGQQTISIGHAPNGADINTPYQYDAYGRMTREWLSFPSAEVGLGAIKPNNLLKSRQYYQTQYTDDFTVNTGGSGRRLEAEREWGRPCHRI
jgi:hypothetical protein